MNKLNYLLTLNWIFYLMKAMILSAGFGTRLGHLTENLPKALVSYKGIPMINYQIERLVNAGADEIIVNAHHYSGMISSYFKRHDFGVKISVITEDEILGTGGGVLNAGKYFKDEKYFVVINADIDTDIDLRKAISFHISNSPFATLVVQKRKSKRYLEFDSEMKLIGRENDNSDKEYLFAFNGIHIVSAEIFNEGFEIKYRDILDIYFEVLQNDKSGKIFVKGFDAGKSLFKDLGKTENL